MLPENDPKKPSPARVGIWLVVGAIGAWMLISGLVGVVTSGG
ncbi:hypothetical protein ACIQLJ_13140 [Microbacterium sp. NPDC091313]